jgi:hypothetical protein
MTSERWVLHLPVHYLRYGFGKPTVKLGSDPKSHDFVTTLPDLARNRKF